MRLHLGGRTGVDLEVVLDTTPFVVVDGVERVGTEEFVEFVGVTGWSGHVVLLSTHRHSVPTLTPACTSSTRRRLRPERIRLFTVPSGSPSRSAASL